MRIKVYFQFFFYLSFLIPLSALSLPRQISPPGERMVLVSPRENQWGAYDPNGRLIRSGIASLGADYCPDMGQECHTETGHFRIRSLGGAGCVSPSFPMPNGGAPMPFCMYFN